ncbi:MAG: D-alanine--D-alanine ligase [Clostridia bacterium]|nr:D-alanine--D-alanine ligase [Clostridia bacterium]
MNIVVLCGGLSAERDVSLCTGSLVAQALLRKGHNAVLADVIGDYDIADNDYKKYIETCRDREAKIYTVSKQAPDIKYIRAQVEAKGKGIFGRNVLNLCMASDIVFMALHGGEGEDGRIQAALDLFGVKYTGSNSLGSAVAMSKRYTKQIFEINGILSPEYKTIFIDDYTEELLDNTKLPCVVKLSGGGSSIGVYIANTKDELKKALDEAFSMEDTVIIEEYIEGVEYTCGVFNGVGLPVVEIRPNEGFYDYEHKYQAGTTVEICPAPSLTDEQAKLMQEIAVKAHNALDLDVYSRADFIIDSEGRMYCLESNTLPGMTPTSLLPQEAKAVGIDYDELCHQMVMLSLDKYK